MQLIVCLYVYWYYNKWYMPIFEKVLENDFHAKLNTSEFLKVWQLVFHHMITFLLSNVFEFMILRFFVLLQQKVSSMFLSNVFWHAHSTHLWPSMNFGLQLSSYKFHTISSKATSIDYNHHPNFSSDPTNIHDLGFQFHISKFSIVCG